MWVVDVVKAQFPSRKHCTRCKEFLAPFCFRPVAHSRCRGYLARADECRRCELERKKNAAADATALELRTLKKRELRRLVAQLELELGA